MENIQLAVGTRVRMTVGRRFSNGNCVKSQLGHLMLLRWVLSSVIGGWLAMYEDSTL